MRPAVAAIVVFLAAAAVLIMEILAARLMAPYVGVSLNTYTGIIGTVLAGIAAGAWIGGKAADRFEPRRLLGPLLVAGGVLALGTAPVTTVLGEHLHSESLTAIIALSAATVFLPAFVLSGVTPIVVKMQLQSLKVTGSVVGRMSAFGTAGALVGTFGTGFFLTAEFPTRVILAGVGGILIVSGAVLWWWLGRRVEPLAIVVLLAGILLASAAAATVRGPCKVESAYFCIRVERIGADGRILVLDNLEHSYVNLRNPRDLEFPYIQMMGGVIDTLAKPKAPITALHIGGGAFTLPRYIAATRPGSMSTVIEIDPAVVEAARRYFGLRTSPRLRVQIGDARVAVQRKPRRSYNVIIGDAFGGRSVPWQLTTKEFLTELRGLLKPSGVYVMNVIDTRTRFVRAEAATMMVVFPRVVLFPLGENYVLVGSSAPLNLAALARRDISQPVTGQSLRRFVGHAQILKDDFAPVDQLLR